MKKRLLSVLLAAMFTVSTVTPALADEEDDLREQRAQAEEELDDTQAALNDLAAKRQEIQAQISELNADIVDLMVQIDQAQKDIDTTSTKIDETTTEIAETEVELEESEQKRDKQHDDMMKRIQYIYENGGNVGWVAVMLDSDDITSFANKAEYASELHAADRSALQEYIDTVDEIEELKAGLEDKKASLEEKKTLLENQKASLENQNAELNRQLEVKKATDVVAAVADGGSCCA